MKFISIKIVFFVYFLQIISTCQRGCLMCQQKEGGLCLQCDSTQGFVLENGLCIDVQQIYCMQFSNASHCKQCIPFYSFYSIAKDGQDRKVCQFQIEKDCMVYNQDNKCIKCSYDYFIKDDQCIKITNDNLIKGCMLYLNKYECDQCKLDYILINNECIKIDKVDKVDSCAEYTQQTCKQCKDNFQYHDDTYYLSFFNKLHGNDQIYNYFDYDYNKQVYYSREQCFKKDIKNCLIFKTNLECQQCNTGYYINNGQCLQNPKEPLIDCDIHTNTDLKTCQLCYIDSYLTISRQCIKLQDSDYQKGCNRYKQVNDLVQCMICEDNYYLLKGQCIERSQEVKNCNTFNLYKDSCIDCIVHYIPNMINDRILCIKKFKNCQQALNGICIRCDDYYLLQNNKCEGGTDQYCLQYKNQKCVECQNGYQIIDGLCKESSHNLKNCLKLQTFEGKILCTQCQDNYLNLQVNSHCQQVDPYCQIYEDDNETCKECQKDYYLKEGNCVQKFCTKFDQDLDCIECQDYYQLVNKKCIENEYQQKIQEEFILQQQENCQINQVLFKGTFDMCLGAEYTINNCELYQRLQGQIVCKICEDNYYLQVGNQQCIKECEVDQKQLIIFVNEKQKFQCIDNHDKVFQNCQKLIEINNEIQCVECKPDFGIVAQCGKQNYHECIQLSQDIDESNCHIFEYNDNNKLVCKQCKFGYYFSLDNETQLYSCTKNQYCDIDFFYKVDDTIDNLFKEITNNKFNEVISCHKYTDQNNIVQIIQQEVSLDTGISQLNKEIIVVDQIDKLPQNCAFGIKLQFGQEIDYQCMACYPGYKPIYDNLFIVNCELIQKCNLNFVQQHLNKCQQCDSEYQLSDDQQECIREDNTNIHYIKQQIPNCLDSDYIKIIKDNSNYHIDLNYKGCFICSSDQIKVSIQGQNCMSLVNNYGLNSLKDSITLGCSKFDQNFLCQACKQNFAFLEQKNQCLQNKDLQNCKFAKNETQCLQCEKNYFIYNYKCFQQKIDNCIEMNNELIQCIKCEDGYFLKDNKCLKGQIENCQKYKQNQYNNCQTCYENYQLLYDNSIRGIQCMKIQKLDQCLKTSHSIVNDSYSIGCNFCQNNQQIVHENFQIGCQQISIYSNCDQYDHNSNHCVKCSDLYYNLNGVCKKRYYLTDLCIEYDEFDDSCKQCEEDYLWDKNKKKCIRIQFGIAGCLEYNNINSCKVCQRNYYLNEQYKCTKIQQIITGCQTYYDKDTCIQCDEFYKVQKDKCTYTTIPNCINWIKNYKGNNTCLQCSKNYYLIEKDEIIVCQKIKEIPYCLTYEQKYDKIYCKKCQEGYYYDNNEMVCMKDDTEKQQIENCKFYQYTLKDKLKCSECQKNYYLNTQQDECIKNSIRDIQYDCLIQQQLQKPVCKRCNKGHYLDKNLCKECDDVDHCNYCNPLNPGQCLLCGDGYQINEDGSCLSTMAQVQDVQFKEMNLNNSSIRSFYLLLLIVILQQLIQIQLIGKLIML